MITHHKIQKNKGFTLIEMLVSVAIFSIILTIIMGTIVSIVDTSRKARTMTEVMNNLNFTFENITRTLKTATSISGSTGGSQIVATDQNGDEITYSIEKDVDNIYKIYKSTAGATAQALTSDDVEIIQHKIELLKSNDQPRVFFSIKGRVKTAKGIFSDFSMQSTVSQRFLIVPATP